MSDFIKDFNMTDFLGIMFPGSVFFVILAKEMNIWSHLYNLWGSYFGVAAQIAVVLILGYVIGMLIHEIGDIIERMMWVNPILNPRIYAALFVGVATKYPIYGEKEKTKKKMSINDILEIVKSFVFSLPAVLLRYYCLYR